MSKREIQERVEKIEKLNNEIKTTRSFINHMIRQNRGVLSFKNGILKFRSRTDEQYWHHKILNPKLTTKVLEVVENDLLEKEKELAKLLGMEEVE